MSHVQRSSGNVFADLDLPNPEEHRVKANIALAIAETIRQRGLTQGEAAEILGAKQPKVSDLMRGKLDKFTTDRLLRYAKKLDYNITITLKPKSKNQAQGAIQVRAPGIPSLT